MSGSVRPLTTTSPWPQAASTTTRSRRPLTGSAVNATPGLLGGCHQLDHDGDVREVVLAVFGPVGDDAGREGRRPALRDRVEQRVGPPDVGERGVHAGVGGVGAVLADRGGSHRDRRIGPQQRVLRADALGDLRGQAGPPDAVLQQEAGRRQAVLGRAGRPFPRGGQGRPFSAAICDRAASMARRNDAARTTKPPGTGNPAATISPRFAPLPPARSTSAEARRDSRATNSPTAAGSAPPSSAAGRGLGAWRVVMSVIGAPPWGDGPTQRRGGGPPPGPPVPWHADLRPSVRCAGVSRGDRGGGSRGCPAGRSGTPRRGRGRAGRSN